MNHQTIHAANAPAAVGPYCHAMLCGDTLYTSGQLGLIPETGVLPEGVVAQAKQALDNLGAVLQAAACETSGAGQAPTKEDGSGGGGGVRIEISASGGYIIYSIRKAIEQSAG